MPPETLPLVERSLKPQATKARVKLLENAPLPNGALTQRQLSQSHADLKKTLQKNARIELAGFSAMLTFGAIGAAKFFSSTDTLGGYLREIDAPLGSNPEKLEKIGTKTKIANSPFNGEVINGAVGWSVGLVGNAIEGSRSNERGQALARWLVFYGTQGLCAYIAAKGFLVKIENLSTWDKSLAITLQIAPTGLSSSLGFWRFFGNTIRAGVDHARMRGGLGNHPMKVARFFYPDITQPQMTIAEFIAKETELALLDVTIEKRRELEKSIRQATNGSSPSTHRHAQIFNLLFERIQQKKSNLLTTPPQVALTENEAKHMATLIVDLCTNGQRAYSLPTNLALSILLWGGQLPSLIAIAIEGQHDLKEEGGFFAVFAWATHPILYGMLFGFAWNFLRDIFYHARSGIFVAENLAPKLLFMAVNVIFILAFVRLSFGGSTEILLGVVLAGLLSGSPFGWFVTCAAATVISNSLACFSMLSSILQKMLLSFHSNIQDAHIGNLLIEELITLCDPKQGIMQYPSAREYIQQNLDQIPQPPPAITGQALNGVN